MATGHGLSLGTGRVRTFLVMSKLQALVYHTAAITDYALGLEKLSVSGHFFFFFFFFLGAQMAVS